MAQLSSENKVCYVMADWNLDLMKHHCHDLTGQFLDTMFSRSFVPLITRPTRITTNTATLIDNIFTNDILLRIFLITSQSFVSLPNPSVIKQ